MRPAGPSPSTAPASRPATSHDCSTGWPPSRTSTSTPMGDPRVGMVGASYGGGIQLVAAATDCRIDVITPTITWHSLRTSLYTADTFKIGWANILTKLGTGHPLDPHVTSASAGGQRLRRRWARPTCSGSPNAGRLQLLGQINVPTLIIQGTVDNLFTLDEGVRNYAEHRQERCTDGDALVLRRPWCLPHRRRRFARLRGSDPRLARPLPQARRSRTQRYPVSRRSTRTVRSTASTPTRRRWVRRFPLPGRASSS